MVSLRIAVLEPGDSCHRQGQSQSRSRTMSVYEQDGVPAAPGLFRGRGSDVFPPFWRKNTTTLIVFVDQSGTNQKRLRDSR